MVSANGTVIDDYIPGPQGDGIPLLDLEAFLVVVLAVDVTAFAVLFGNRGGSGTGSIGHINVGHFGSVVLCSMWLRESMVLKRDRYRDSFGGA